MADITIDGTTIGANRFLFLDSTGKIPAVDGSQVTAIAAGNIATGTIPIARIDTGTTANKIVKLDGNAKLPALDGSLLTNVSSSTKSASDPTISTNPSGGVGTEWHNTTSGEVYICTDATAGANVWTNVGAGTDNIQPWLYGGTQYGYSHCGGAYPYYNTIDKWSFTSDANAADVGDNTDNRAYLAANHSSTHGYVSGGETVGTTNIIDKNSYATDGNATDVGDLSWADRWSRGQSSETQGYSTGFESHTTAIQKISFSSDGNAVASSAVLTSAAYGYADASSTDYGYCAGGQPYNNVIQKFSFTADNNATDVGDLLATKWETTGVSSATYGYSCGASAPQISNVIDRYSFSTDGNSTDVGDLAIGGARGWAAGSSSQTYGYIIGGGYPTALNVIEKFSFSTDGNTTDVGDLTVARYGLAGSEY